MLVMLDRSIQFMRHNTATFQQVDYHDGFYTHEVENLQRVYNIASAEWQGSLSNQISRRDFYLYISEHDRRNQTDFKSVFPEIGYFYDQCKREYEESMAAKAAENKEE
jgi:hypothetical protein